MNFSWVFEVYFKFLELKFKKKFLKLLKNIDSTVLEKWYRNIDVLWGNRKLILWCINFEFMNERNPIYDNVWVGNHVWKDFFSV